MIRIRTIDLFAGAGGITEGFRQAGADCLFANDFNPYACETFRLNHPRVDFACGPIQDLDTKKIRKSLSLKKEELDVLVGGPPCQGFSINAPERFTEDPRNSLFKHYLRFVSHRTRQRMDKYSLRTSTCGNEESTFERSHDALRSPFMGFPRRNNDD